MLIDVLTHTKARCPVVAALGVLCLLVTLPAGGVPYRLRIGDTMPDVELPRLEGGALRLGTLRGQIVTLSFYSPYCEPCRRELPALKRAVERVTRDRGTAITVVIVVTEDRPPAELVKEHAGALWLLDTDNRARGAFDPRTLPCTFLVDAKGKVRHINRGFGSGYEARVEKWLRGIAGGRHH
jgi:thiol-disulfide isomerase/thioredoxin